MAENNQSYVTHNRGCFATKLKDARLEMLGRLHCDYLCNAVRSGELIDGPCQKSSRKEGRGYVP